MIIKVLKSALKLVPTDCNYSFMNEKMGPILVRDKRIQNRGVLFNLALFLKELIKETLYIFKHKFIKNKTNIAFYITSENQYAIAKNIIQDSDVYYHRKESLSGNRFPLLLSYIISCFFIPLLIHNHIKLSKIKKKLYINKLDYNLLMYGHYIVCRFLFKNYNMVILLNDHEMWTRVAKIAAEDEGVKTIYIQHASINENFPVLDFDIAFLDGQYSKDTYKKIGVSNDTQIYLVGSPKYDRYKRDLTAFKDSRDILLLCVNLKDELELIDNFLKKESSSYETIILRSHPSDRRNWNKIISKYNLKKSTNKEIYEDLKLSTRQIASESNVHLDALMSGVMTYYVNFTSSEIQDHYDFIKNGLITLYNEREALDLEKVKKALKYYMHSIGETYDGRVSQHIKQIINEVETK
ncbi:MAG: hypothetical protein WD059_04935 [Balneolaceae bacterium]